MIDWSSVYPNGLGYADFLDRHGSPEHRRRWADLHAAVRITDAQRALLARFTRAMNVACLAGAWCGDCVYQCPILEHIAAACPLIKVCYWDRDAAPDLAAELKVCGGSRVPIVVFLSEDLHE